MFGIRFQIGDSVCNIKIMFVNPSHNRITWADNLLRTALIWGHPPRNGWEGQTRPKILLIILL